MTRLTRLGCVAALALLTGRAWGAEPTAADRATARALAEEGGQALDTKQYEKAADRFARADALVHAPSLVLELARAQAGMGKYVEAHESYLRILREGVPPNAPQIFQRALLSAKDEEKVVGAKRAWATLSVGTGTTVGSSGSAPTGVKVSLDGEDVPRAALDVRRAVNPGRHTVKATADGFDASQTIFNVTEGQSISVTLSLRPMPKVTPTPLARASNASASATEAKGDSALPSAHDPSKVQEAPLSVQVSGATGTTGRTLGILALGVGGLGLAVGGVAGAIALGKHQALEQACPAGNCPPSENDNLSSYRSTVTVTTAGIAVGVVGVVAGTILYLVYRPRSGSAMSETVSPTVGVDGAGLRVAFQ